MKNTRHLFATGLLACALSASTTVVLADGYFGPMFGPPPSYRAYDYGYGREYGRVPPVFDHRMFEGRDYYAYLADRLDLSDEQRRSVRDVLERARADARKLGETLRDNREQMRDNLEDKGYGPDFDRLAKKQGELIGQMISLRAKTRSQIMGVLSDGQKKALKDLRERRHHRDDYYDHYGWGY
jgi:Spy/CpxP family protein refolding chaperone